jgi:acetyl esterase/lipase
VYKTVGDSQLLVDVYEPRAADGLRPGILLIHGGGWSAGAPDLLEPHCRYFAERGMVAVNVQYRLVDEERGTRIADCLADVRDALAWVRANAARWAVDPDRVVVAGESAGGHLAAALAVLGPKAPAAAVLWNPVLDLTATPWINAKHPGLSPAGAAPEGQTWKDRAAALSPTLHVHDRVPPTLVIHGRADKVVPVAQARAFAEAMETAGNTVQIHEPRHCGHACILAFEDNRKTAV